MSLNTWQETLVTAQVDGTALTNTVTPTSILPAAAKYTLPANFMQIGRQLRVLAMGRISNVTAAPGNLTLDVKFGATSVFTGGAIPLSTTVHTNVTWWLDVLMTCRAIGAGTTATLMGIGQLTTEALGATANIAVAANLPVSAPAVGTGFDSTVAQVVDLFATFSVANAANSITLHGFSLQSLN